MVQVTQHPNIPQPLFTDIASMFYTNFYMPHLQRVCIMPFMLTSYVIFFVVLYVFLLQSRSMNFATMITLTHVYMSNLIPTIAPTTFFMPLQFSTPFDPITRITVPSIMHVPIHGPVQPARAQILLPSHRVLEPRTLSRPIYRPRLPLPSGA
jgi:hypothetical protein